MFTFIDTSKVRWNTAKVKIKVTQRPTFIPTSSLFNAIALGFHNTEKNFHRASRISTADMNDSSAEGSRDRYRAVARAFIKRSIRDNCGSPTWNGRTPDRHWNWLNSTRNMRGGIPPSLFEYADRRSKGLEPPPGQYTWLGTSKSRRDYHRYIRQLGK